MNTNYPIQLDLTAESSEISDDNLREVIVAMVKDGGLYEIKAFNKDRPALLDKIYKSLKVAVGPTHDQQFGWIHTSSVSMTDTAFGVKIVLLWKEETDPSRKTREFILNLKLV